MNIYLVTQITTGGTLMECRGRWVVAAKNRAEAEALLPPPKNSAFFTEQLGVVPPDLSEGYWGTAPWIILSEKENG